MLDRSRSAAYDPEMSIMQPAVAALAQQLALPDTVLARVIPERGAFEYASGTLEILVLVLTALGLATLVWVLLTVRKAVMRMEHSLKVIVDGAKPILVHATAVAQDTRKTVARLSEDVERVTDAAATVSEQLLDAAETTARRIDEVNAVLDVVQDELENVAISSVAAMKGVRVGATEMASALGNRNGRRKVSRSARARLEARRRQDALPDEVEPG